MLLKYWMLTQPKAFWPFSFSTIHLFSHLTMLRHFGNLSYKRPRRIRQMLSAAALLALLLAPTVVAKEKLNLEQQEKEYLATAFPLVRQYCLDCHSTDAREGELDLERFSSFDQVRRDSQAWQKIASMLSNGEMPPADSPQLEPREKQLLQDWVQKFLDAEARANAGDPGPVVLRRLNNAEYTYTIRDLTGVHLSPTHEFPADGRSRRRFYEYGQRTSDVACVGRQVS